MRQAAGRACGRRSDRHLWGGGVRPPIDPHAAIIDLSDSPWATAGILSQASQTANCPWAPSGAEAFVTECEGITFARYLYAAQWDGTTFATGTRRAPQEEPARCWGDSWQGGGERGYYASGVPYDPALEAWALNRSVRIFGLEGSSYTRLENYTACFPVAKDGEVRAIELGCEGYPRLYAVNGLAGGGIARGPAAGEHVARLVAAELGLGKPPHAHVPFFSGVTIVMAYLLGGLGLVATLSACCACAFWLELHEDFRTEARQAAIEGVTLSRHRVKQLKTARRRRAACVTLTAFVVSTEVLCVLTAMTAIAWEGYVLLAPYAVAYLALNITLCTGFVRCPAELARRCFCCWAVRAADSKALYLPSLWWRPSGLRMIFRGRVTPSGDPSGDITSEDVSAAQAAWSNAITGINRRPTPLV